MLALANSFLLPFNTIPKFRKAIANYFIDICQKNLYTL